MSAVVASSEICPFARLTFCRLSALATFQQAESVSVQPRRVDLHAHSGERAAADNHLADALDLRKPLHENRGRRVVKAPAVVDVGGQRQDHDRRVGRIHLPPGRVARQVGGQIGAGGVDGGLDVPGGAVNVPVQGELQGDAGRTQRARGGHFGHAGDAAELAFQRRGDRRSHDLRAGARQARTDGNGRKIHLRQRRHGQHQERDRSAERDGRRQQRRGHRPMDEGRGKAHGCFTGTGPPLASAARPPTTSRRAGRRKCR